MNTSVSGAGLFMWHLYPLTFLPMLWRIRYLYGTYIEAPTKSEAFAKAKKLIQIAPDTVISTVEDARLAGKPTPLWRRFLTGK